MKYQIQITNSAERDMYEIRTYVAHTLKEPQTALSLLRKINVAIISLEEFPIRHEITNEITLSIQGIRILPIENYLVFYVINEEDKIVSIVRVLSKRRNWIDLI